jgi:hypothetical protein
MDIVLLVRSGAVFFIVAIAMAMNLDDNLMARLGLAGNYGLILTASIVVTLFLIGRNIWMVAGVLVLCLVTNMPADFSLNFGYDRDLYAGLMLAMLFQPLLARAIEN